MTEESPPPREFTSIPIETPPARLLRLLQFMVIGEKADTMNAHQVGKVLAMTMQELPHDRSASWSLAHASLLALVTDARDYVRDRESKYEGSPHEDTFNELEDILATLPLQDGWHGHRKRLNTLVKSSLRFSVHEVGKGRLPAAVTQDDVEGLRAELRAIRERVSESNWAIEFKAEMLEAIGNLLDRLGRFRVHGVEGVGRATAQVIGTLALNHEAARSTMGLTRDMLDLANKIADVVLKYTAVGIIGAEALRRLGAGG